MIIADDHPIFRSGLRAVIETDPSFSVIGEASDGQEALGMIVNEKPSIAILDYNMPKLNGFEVLKQILKLKIDVSPVVLTMHNDEGVGDKCEVIK